MPRAVAITVALMCAAGCRFGFSERPVTVTDAADATDTPLIDAPPADAPPDARIVTQIFGERPGSMNTGVTVDTHVVFDQPTLNFGAFEDMSLYGGGTLERGLVGFDLSSIAPGTLVVAARFEIELVDFGDNVVGGLGLRLVGEAWSETSATWNLRQTGITWAMAGGTPSAALTMIGSPSGSVVFTVPVTVAQSWIDAPATNFGFIVGAADETTDTHYHLHTSESLVLTGRPQLVLDLVE